MQGAGTGFRGPGGQSALRLPRRIAAAQALTARLPRANVVALELGRLKDAGMLRPEQVSLGMLNNVREALAIAGDCRTILGGITLEFQVLSHANNLEPVLTYEGASEEFQQVVGQAVTGHAAFR